MKNILIAVQGHIQLIAGYISAEWLRNISNDKTQNKIVLLIYDLMVSKNDEEILVAGIKQLSTIRKWDKVIFINGTEMKALARGRYSKRITRLQTILGYSLFHEIHLARDFIGEGSPLIINSYPNAKKILYGDALGVVLVEDNFSLNRDWHFKHLARSFASNLKKNVKTLLFGKSKKYPFDTAVLILPIDVSGKGLESIPLMVPDRRFVTECFAAFSETTIQPTSKTNLLIDKTKSSYLILLSNLSAAGLMTQTNEIALYIDIIMQHIPHESLIYLKKHPRDSADIIKSVKNRLADYNIVTDHGELEMFPVELWHTHLHECVFVPIFSGSAINIKYLYDIDPLFTLDTQKIRKYISPEKVSYVINENQMIIESTKSINSWDGRSLIWHG